MIEIRWHGRGGQGAKTASMLLAETCFNTGKYVQGFPEYGPERMGAPLTAYNRISDTPIMVHCNIYEPDVVVVIDETLLDVLDVCNGLKENGTLIVNTRNSAENIREKLVSFKGKIATIDAVAISMECMGKYFPNTPMLSAVIKATGLIGEDEFAIDMEKLYSRKFASKPEAIEGNMKALKKALKEVKGLD